MSFIFINLFKSFILFMTKILAGISYPEKKLSWHANMTNNKKKHLRAIQNEKSIYFYDILY